MSAFAGIAVVLLLIVSLAMNATLVRWIYHFKQPYTEWTKSTVEKDLKVCKQFTVHPSQLAFFATGLTQTVMLNGVSLIGESEESIQLTVLVRIIYLPAPDLRRLARPIESDP